MGMPCFLVQKCTRVTKVSCVSVHLPFVLAPFEALQGFVRPLDVLEVFGMVWKVLEGFAGFGGFCEAMGSFERRGESLGGFGRFYRLCMALSCFGRLWLWKVLGSF